MVDIVKGSVVGFVLALVSLSLYVGLVSQSAQTLTVIVFLILTEFGFLYWFVWRGDGKRIQVDFWHLLTGILIGFVILTTLLMFIFAIPIFFGF